MFQDLVEESSLGVVTEIELLAKSLHNHSRVVILVHFDLLNVLPVELNFQDADRLILSEVRIKIVSLRRDGLFVLVSSSSARPF